MSELAKLFDRKVLIGWFEDEEDVFIPRPIEEIREDCIKCNQSFKKTIRHLENFIENAKAAVGADFIKRRQ